MFARRSVLHAMASVPLAGVPLAAILSSPRLARAAASTLEKVSITTEGGRKASAALALPAKTPAPAMVLVHEWWGLNDQIKSVAMEFAREGYVALAVDLFGKVATTREEARKLSRGTEPKVATDIMASWIEWMKKHPKATGKVATVGWCFGGGWSLNASIAAPVDATVIYYGRVNRRAADLARLEGPVLGHFATEDRFINKEMVGGFEQEMDKAGKAYTHYWYDADHAFANPTGSRYDAEDAKLAWRRTLAFLGTHLR